MNFSAKIFFTSRSLYALSHDTFRFIIRSGTFLYSVWNDLGVRIIIIIRIIIRIKKRQYNNRKDSYGIVGILNKEKTLQ